jgi:sec-independent protein translocase protein TatB
MFDVGFSELCLIGLVSLLVIGPEKLPKVARLAGFWLGKTRHMVASVKEEIRQELQAEEMRQILKEQSALQDVQQIFNETSDTLKSTIAPLPVASNLPSNSDSGPIAEVAEHKEPLPSEKTDQDEAK